MLDIHSHTFLSDEQIKEKAGSIFASAGSSNTSEKYTHIPTNKIIEDMKLLKKLKHERIKVSKNT